MEPRADKPVTVKVGLGAGVDEAAVAVRDVEAEVARGVQLGPHEAYERGAGAELEGGGHVTGAIRAVLVLVLL